MFVGCICDLFVNYLSKLSGWCVAPADFRSAPRGTGGRPVEHGERRQSGLVATLFDWCFLLHSDVHGLQRAPHRALPQVHTHATGIPR